MSKNLRVFIFDAVLMSLATGLMLHLLVTGAAFWFPLTVIAANFILMPLYAYAVGWLDSNAECSELIDRQKSFIDDIFSRLYDKGESQ